MSKKRSPIWNFFPIGEDTRLARCKACNKDISRGGKTTKTYNTTNLTYHLRTEQADKYSDYWRQQIKKKTHTLRSNFMLLESSDRSRMWDINDPRAQAVHENVVLMIPRDCQPFSIVDDDGSICLKAKNL